MFFIIQFLASQELIVHMIFEWLEFPVEVLTEKTEKVPQKTEKYRKKTKKKTEGNSKFQIWDKFFFRVFWVAIPPPSFTMNCSISSDEQFMVGTTFDYATRTIFSFMIR